MRNLTLFPAAVLSLGLLGCDSSTAADAAPAAAVVATVPAPKTVASASTLVAPATIAAPASQDAQDVSPPPTDNPGMMPRGQAARPPQTLAQMQARNDQMFARLDANADGAITGDELAVLTGGPQGARGGGRLREMIARADADRNARITLEELRSGTAQRFARMDANGDGVVTDEERPDRP